MQILQRVDSNAGGTGDYVKFFQQSLLQCGVKCKIDYRIKCSTKAIDLLHYQMGNSSWKVGSDIFFHNHVPKVITLHDMLPRRKLPRKIYPLVLKQVLKQADIIILHSNHALNMFKILYGPELLQKVEILPHGSKILTISKEFARHKLNLHTGKFIFLVPGNVKPSKGVEDIIQAFKEIQGNNATLIIVGSGKKKYLESLKNLCEDDMRVIFFGFATENELDLLISASDVVVLYKNETLGESSGILHRAIGAKKPVISSDRGSNPEILSGYGVIVRSGAPHLLAKCMQKVMINTNLRVKAIKGMSCLAEEYSWKSVAESHIALYRNLIGAKK